MMTDGETDSDPPPFHIYTGVGVFMPALSSPRKAMLKFLLNKEIHQLPPLHSSKDKKCAIFS